MLRRDSPVQGCGMVGISGELQGDVLRAPRRVGWEKQLMVGQWTRK